MQGPNDAQTLGHFLFRPLLEAKCDVAAKTDDFVVSSGAFCRMQLEGEEMHWFLRWMVCFLGCLMISTLMASANPLNRWQISCAVDKGAITKSGKTWIFKTSSNRCPGGIFNQRAEIYTDKISPTKVGTYRFRSNISVRSPSNEKFAIFQIHDGRLGCAPPLMVRVQPTGHLTINGDYKIGNQPGENCVRNILTKSGQSKARIRRDGTPYDLQVILDFDGQSGFDVYVYLDNALQITGSYQIQPGKGYFVSKHFYFKHGSYSQNMFPYEIISRDMKVDKVRLK